MPKRRKTRKTHRAKRKPNVRAMLVKAAFASAKRAGRRVNTKTIFRMSNAELQRFAGSASKSQWAVG